MHARATWITTALLPASDIFLSPIAMGLTSKLDKLKLHSDHGEGHHAAGAPAAPAADASGDTDDIDEVDNEGQLILMSIIAQLRPGCDLSKITLPTFILEKKLMLERITNFFEIPELLLAANAEQDPVERFVLMLKWYLASWHIAPKAVKKPLNPVLGEVFTCYWDDLPGNQKAYYVAEQTSHHPPKSSYFYLCPELKIRVDGVVIPKLRFLGNSLAALMDGWGHVTLGNHGGEMYVMNQPNVYARGILFGKMFTELGDHMVVKCEATGMTADIEFKTKGFILGTYHAIAGSIKKDGEELYQVSGKWNEVMDIKDMRTGKKEVLYDTTKLVLDKPKVRPVEEQWDYESRRLWKPTIDALSHRDHDTATAEKYKVENDQREKAKKRIEDGVEWYPKFFRPVHDNEPEVQDLEYIIYKPMRLSESSEQLENDVLTMAPFLPGQKFDERFEIPAFKKKE